MRFLNIESIQYESRKNLVIVDFEENYLMDELKRERKLNSSPAQILDNDQSVINVNERSARSMVLKDVQLTNLFPDVQLILCTYWTEIDQGEHQFSAVNLVKYLKNDFYRPHYDSKFEGNANLRVLTFVYFFTAKNLQGGNLLIYPQGEKIAFSIKPKPGRMLIFPSDTLHEVEEVLLGERESLVCWLERKKK